jgi:hypothetical protein
MTNLTAPPNNSLPENPIAGNSQQQGPTPLVPEEPLNPEPQDNNHPTNLIKLTVTPRLLLI